MWKALALKELRETAGIVAVALVADLLLLSAVTGEQLFPWEPRALTEIPFLGSTFITWFVVIAALLALALGFRQTVWEGVRDTYLFLLHQPLPRESILGAKLLVGVSLLLIGTAIPILGYAWWAATPGTHASPFYWSMTEVVWKVWLSMPLLYLAAFLSGLRPARWYGSRLLPVAAAALAVLGIQVLPWWWVLGLGATVGLAMLFVATILYVARVRDYP